jgi:ribose 5-phosphate isomerase A
MDQNALKEKVSRAALEEIRGDVREDSVLGIGTGTTADIFIDLLCNSGIRFRGAVSSSERSAERLARQGVKIFDLNDVDGLELYIDGADEITESLHMLKGGGGALTREKIVASAARRFVCIADGSKLVPKLGKFGLPIEVIPMARAQIERTLLQLHGAAGKPDIRLRQGADGKPFTTDNHNQILDVHGLFFDSPVTMEEHLDGIVGTVCNGLFAKRGADVLLLARESGDIARYLRPV